MIENKEVIVSENELSSVVQKLLNLKDVELLTYDTSEYQGGTLGNVILYKGTCKSENIKKDFEVVLKVQNKWGRFGDPESWFREYSIYKSDIFDNLPSGFNVPKCIKSRKEDEKIWLWIEKVEGIHDSNLLIDDYGLIADRVGEFESKYINHTLNYSWFSSKYWFQKNVNIFSSIAINWLLDESNNGKSILSNECNKKLLKVWADRDKLIDKFMNLPKTICHRDLTPGNVFVNNNVVNVIDWDCVGNGIVGEDISDLFMEALVYYDFELNNMSDLEETLITNYHNQIKDKVSLEDLKTAFDLNLLLVWSNRIINMFERSDEAKIKRYINILEYITKR